MDHLLILVSELGRTSGRQAILLADRKLKIRAFVPLEKLDGLLPPIPGRLLK